MSIFNDLKKLNNDKRGQVQGVVVLLALILVGGIGGIISLNLFTSVRNNLPAAISSNTQLIAVETTYIPLFIVGIVAGTAIAGLIYAILFVFGRRNG